MDTKVIEVNKNVAIGIAVNNAATQSYPFTINNVSFVPDVVVVKVISFYQTNGAAAIQSMLVYSDLVSDILGSTVSYYVALPNSSFTLKKPVKGQYNIQLFDPTVPTNPTIITPASAGVLIIHLDFIKYASVPPQKVY